MTKLKYCPRHSRGKWAPVKSAHKAQSRLQAETTVDVRVAHELFLLGGKVAVDRQCAIYFANERCLGFYSNRSAGFTLKNAICW
jgi:hypothetical protein